MHDAAAGSLVFTLEEGVVFIPVCSVEWYSTK